jgi:hypothetical protein
LIARLFLKNTRNICTDNHVRQWAEEKHALLYDEKA